MLHDIYIYIYIYIYIFVDYINPMLKSLKSYACLFLCDHILCK
jgi:hypothetical protein